MPRSFPVARGALAIASLLTAFGLAACSNTPTAPRSLVAPPSPNLTTLPPYLDQPGLGHVLHTRDWFETFRHMIGGGPNGSASPMVYHGGPILLRGSKVAAIYWASAPIYVNGPPVGTSGPGLADASLVGFFLRHLGGSSYYNINSTYYTNVAGARIANAIAYTQFWANGSSAPSGSQVVTRDQIVDMLQSGLNTGALQYDPATLYAVFTSGAVNPGGGFGTLYCSIHGRGTVMVNGSPRTILFAAMPYALAYPSECTSGYAPANGSADPGADYEVNVLAYEAGDATTDELGNGWYDSFGLEDGDKCAWTWGTTFTTPSHGVANVVLGGMPFLVQRNWPVGGGCEISH